MRRVIPTLVLAGLVGGCVHSRSVSVQPSPEAASAKRSSWAAVQALPAGSSVSVQLWTSPALEGDIVSSNGEQLVVLLGGAAIRLQRLAIRRITLVGNRTVARRARWGFLIGAIAGATVGATTAETNRGRWALFLSGGWGGLGALFGAIDGMSSRERTLIFDSSQP